jgi:N-acetylmuramoyl-L-alanine amidase
MGWFDWLWQKEEPPAPPIPVIKELVEWQKLLPGARTWTHVVWHHSATIDQRTYDWGAIKRYHIEDKGWSDIGYHFGIERVEGALQVNVGRPLSKVGAHTVGMNEKAIGVCVVGNFDVKSPDAETVEMMVKLGREIMSRLPSIKPENHHFHREFTNEKTCPGTKFVSLPELRKRLV